MWHRPLSIAGASVAQTMSSNVGGASGGERSRARYIPKNRRQEPPPTLGPDPGPTQGMGEPWAAHAGLNGSDMVEFRTPPGVSSRPANTCHWGAWEYSKVS